MGPCNITITIEDENAKLPLSWFVTDPKKADKNTQYALNTFCEWMFWDRDREQRNELKDKIVEAMSEIQEKKTFTINPSPIILKTTTPRTNERSRRGTSQSRQRTAKKAVQETRPVIADTTDFAKLFHSSLLDQEMLAKPLADTGEWVKSPLDYLSLWGAQRVNVNTAPRHVLEAAFMLSEVDSFDLPEFTHKVIEARQKEPFKKLDDLKTVGQLDAETMKNINNYLTTTSTFFKICISSRSGNARSSAIATVVKEGKKTECLMILYEK